MKSIAISLSPDTSFRDVLLAVKLLISPWVFFGGNYVRLLEQWFRSFFSVSSAVSFNSGRTALFSILESLDIGREDEVILQSFTCVVVPNVIIALGAKPVYVDINKTLTMDPSDLEKKISGRTKAVIVQHTFGIPSDMEKIKRIAKKHKIFVIEDAAHTIGASYGRDKLGALGDAGFFSFGRDKAFSSVFGGMAITNNKTLGKRIKEYQKKLNNPSYFWTVQQLLHPIAFAFILPIYDVFFLGKIMLIFMQKLKLLSFPVSDREKVGKYSFFMAKKYANPLACLALSQVKKLSQFNKRRQDISRIYAEGLNGQMIDFPYSENIPFLRFPILINRREELIGYLKKRHIYVGKWYSEIIDPKGVDLGKVYYKRGSCPNAEGYARKIVNLPTHPKMTIKDARLIKDLINKYVNDKRN